jgi:L-fuculose-phosphate aldolase
MSSAILRMPERRRLPEGDDRARLLQDLLCAFHIIDLAGQPSGMGSHLTARLPGAQTFFFHVHNFGFGEVTPDLIHEADFELNVLDPPADINPTLHIHTRIYLARPDIACIVHTHAKHVAALSAIGANIEPITQGGARLHDDCVFFDEDDGVALGKEPGTLMAQALGRRHAMVLKNHGLLAAGRSIAEAVILADTMEKEAEIQLLAMAAGKLDLPTVAGRERTREYLRGEAMIERSWTYLLRRLAQARPHVMAM